MRLSFSLRALIWARFCLFSALTHLDAQTGLHTREVDENGRNCVPHWAQVFSLRVVVSTVRHPNSSAHAV